MLSTKSSLSNSIKYRIVNMIILISGSALLIGFLINGLVDIEQKKAQLLEQAYSYANIISAGAIPNLINKNSIEEKARLAHLNTASNLKNVQIYIKNETDSQIAFFAGYHRKNTQLLTLTIKDIKHLFQPNFSRDNLMLCKAINQQAAAIGYLCMRLSLDALNQTINNSLYIKLSVLIVSLAIALLLALKLQNSITQPISQLVSLFKHVAKAKDYGIRAPKQTLIELNGLSNAFNTMLDRIQFNLKKQAQAEQEVRILNQTLENKISQRTNALKDSNKELMDTLATLHEYQSQLVENKKMASLGDMVAGIAHEVNTPLGLGITASTLMQDRLSEIQDSLSQKKLTESQLTRFLTESNESLEIIYRNLNRSADLITRFKQLAVNQIHEKRQLFKVKSFLDDVFLSLKPKFHTTKHQVNVDCDPELEVSTQAGALQQVLTNLIMNSLIHGFDHNEKGAISIKAKSENNKLLIEYKDNGKGVSEQLKNKIFDPFVTTKRGSGGNGLGMHLVYNLVTQALQGQISVTSELGQGIYFLIEIPLDLDIHKAQ